MLKFEISAEDSFWQERINRYIKECNSIDELKELSLLIVQVATTRQSVIKGLIKQNLDGIGKGLTDHLSKTKEQEEKDPDWMSKVQKPNPWPGQGEP